MMMIQYYVSSIENDKIEVQQVQNNTKARIHFDTRIEKTESFIQKDKSAAEFFDIK